MVSKSPDGESSIVTEGSDNNPIGDLPADLDANDLTVLADIDRIPDELVEENLTGINHDPASRYLWLKKERADHAGDGAVLAALERLLRYEEDKIERHEYSHGVNSLRAVGLLTLDDPTRFEQVLSESKYANEAYANPVAAPLASHMYAEAFKILYHMTGREDDLYPDLPSPNKAPDGSDKGIELSGYYDRDSGERLQKIEIPPDTVSMFAKTIAAIKTSADMDPSVLNKVIPLANAFPALNEDVLSEGRLDTPGANSLILLQIMDQLGFLDDPKYEPLALELAERTVHYAKKPWIDERYKLGVLRRRNYLWESENIKKIKSRTEAPRTLAFNLQEKDRRAESIVKQRKRMERPSLPRSARKAIAAGVDSTNIGEKTYTQYGQDRGRYQQLSAEVDREARAFESFVDNEVGKLTHDIPKQGIGNTEALEAGLKSLIMFYENHPGITRKAQTFIRNLGGETNGYKIDVGRVLESGRAKAIIDLFSYDGNRPGGGNNQFWAGDAYFHNEFLIRLLVNEVLITSGVQPPTSGFVLSTDKSPYQRDGSGRLYEAVYDFNNEFRTYRNSRFDGAVIKEIGKESTIDRPKNRAYEGLTRYLRERDWGATGSALKSSLIEASQAAVDKLRRGSDRVSDFAEETAKAIRRNKNKAAFVAAASLLLPFTPVAIREVRETLRQEGSPTIAVTEAIERFRDLYRDSDLPEVDIDQEFQTLGPARLYAAVDYSIMPGDGRSVGYMYEGIGFDWPIRSINKGIRINNRDDAELAQITDGDEGDGLITVIGGDNIVLTLPNTMEHNTSDLMVITTLLSNKQQFVPPKGWEVREYIADYDSRGVANLQEGLFGSVTNNDLYAVELHAVLTPTNGDESSRINILENHETEEYVLQPDFDEARRLLAKMDEESSMFLFYDGFINNLENAIETGADNEKISELLQNELQRYMDEYVSTTAYGLDFKDKDNLIESAVNNGDPYYCVVAVDLLRNILKPMGIRTGVIGGTSLYHSENIVHTSRVGHVNTLIALPNGHLIEANSTPSIVEGKTPIEDIEFLDKSKELGDMSRKDGVYTSWVNNSLAMENAPEIRETDTRDLEKALLTLGLAGISVAGLYSIPRLLRRNRGLSDSSNLNRSRNIDTDLSTVRDEGEIDLQAESVAEVLRYLSEIKNENPGGATNLAAYLTMEIFNTSSENMLTIIETIAEVVEDDTSQQALLDFLNSDPDSQEDLYRGLSPAVQRFIALSEEGRQRILDREMNSRLRSIAEGKQPKQDEGMAAMSEILKAIGW